MRPAARYLTAAAAAITLCGHATMEGTLPTFVLIPRADTLEDPAWAASTHRGRCLVGAATERLARLYADGAFAIATPRPAPGEPIVGPPWTKPGLVEVREAGHLAGPPVPDGVVMVPADAAPGGREFIARKP